MARRKSGPLFSMRFVPGTQNDVSGSKLCYGLMKQRAVFCKGNQPRRPKGR